MWEGRVLYMFYRLYRKLFSSQYVQNRHRSGCEADIIVWIYTKYWGLVKLQLNVGVWSCVEICEWFLEVLEVNIFVSFGSECHEKGKYEYIYILCDMTT
jgi:hypothetical protein